MGSSRSPCSEGRGSPPGAGSAARSSVGSQLSRASSGESVPASSFRPQRLAWREGRGGPQPGLALRPASGPGLASRPPPLSAAGGAALRAFLPPGPRFAPSIFWNWPATTAIHFLKPGQRVELQPNSICRYQEQRRKENRELFRPQGASRRVKWPACPHTAELKRDPSSARPHPRQDASGQHSVLCVSVVGGRARRPRRGLSQEAATVEGKFSPRGLGAFSCALSFQLKPCVLREGLRSFCY